MSDAIIHATEENIDTFVEAGLEIGKKFVEIVEKKNICSACMLSYLHAFLADAIVTQDPPKKEQILGGILQTASVMLGQEVVFLVSGGVAPKQELTDTMGKVVDAFLKEMSTKPKGKVN